MIDLSLWRVRIGLFCGTVSMSTVKCGSKRQDSNTQVSSCNIFTGYLAVCFVLVLLHGVVINMRIAWTVDSVCVEKSYVKGTTEVYDYGSQFCQHVAFPYTLAVLCLCATNTVLCVRRLLLSGDIEKNPGPDPHNEDNHQEILSTNEGGSISSDMAKEILTAIQQQSQQQKEQNDAIREDLCDIKNELGKVNQKCEEINQRCDDLETENCRLAAEMSELRVHMADLAKQTTDTGKYAATMTENVEELKEEVKLMANEIDRLEEFSRRDNLRLFGIPQDSDNETPNSCVSAVISALNSVQETKTWTDDDIIRAHRVGPARSGQPRTMIAKFRNWKDKMAILTDKEFRGKLEGKGVRAVNDLTRRQASTVAQARRDGMFAYFSKGKLIVGPRRPDPRTYAEATAGTSAPQTSDPAMRRIAATPSATTQSTTARDSRHDRVATERRVIDNQRALNSDTPTQRGVSPRSNYVTVTSNKRSTPEGTRPTSRLAADRNDRDSRNQTRGARATGSEPTMDRQQTDTRVDNRTQRLGSERQLRSNNK